jgi:hypothetical protein
MGGRCDVFLINSERRCGSRFRRIRQRKRCGWGVGERPSVQKNDPMQTEKRWRKSKKNCSAVIESVHPLRRRGGGGKRRVRGKVGR